ncbi:MAG: hypothetical protein HC872_08480, partial [Gammaproteobacteria bacterium]|nr:hypothetical protein [Gammaproteobacteria bacterium]
MLLLVAVLLASNLVLDFFEGNEDRQTLAVMVVLSAGLIAAILLFALQRVRARRGMLVLEATLPAQRRAELRANAAVFACVAGSV